MSEGENYIVTISNNGNPLATGYDSENVLTYGVSSKEGHGHYGIGGYEVRKLMREFNGEAELISCPNDEFVSLTNSSLRTQVLLHPFNLV